MQMCSFQLKQHPVDEVGLFERLKKEALLPRRLGPMGGAWLGLDRIDSLTCKVSLCHTIGSAWETTSPPHFEGPGMSSRTTTVLPVDVAEPPTVPPALST